MINTTHNGAFDDAFESVFGEHESAPEADGSLSNADYCYQQEKDIRAEAAAYRFGHDVNVPELNFND